MSNGIEVDGFDEISELIQDLIVTPKDEQRALRKAMQPLKFRLEKDTPKGKTKKLSRISVTVKKDGLATVGIVKLGAWWDIFNEFGSSRNKKHIGFFDRSVQSTVNEALMILKQELLDKGR